MDPNGISMLLALHTTPFHKNGEAETTVQRFHADDSPPQFKKGGWGNGRGVRGQRDRLVCTVLVLRVAASEVICRELSQHS